MPINNSSSRLAKIAQRRLTEKLRKNQTDPIPSKWSDFARLCFIRSGSRIIPFEPYNYQIDLCKALDQHGFVMVAKTRQLGITETIACKFLHLAALNPGFTAIILSKSQADASNIAKRVCRMISGTNNLIKLKTANLTDLELENGGRLIFRPSNPNSTRGLESIGGILIDECAFIDKIEDIYTAVMPTIEMCKKPIVALVSTPNGASGFFWDRLVSSNGEHDFLQKCQDIKEDNIDPYQLWVDENDWVKSIIHWKAHPIYSKKDNYLENISKTKQLSLTAVKQEYDLEFIDSQSNVFNSKLVYNAIIDPSEIHPTRFNRLKHIGIDPNFGGGDYCVALVLGSQAVLNQEGGGTKRKYTVLDLYRDNRASIDKNLSGIFKTIDKYTRKKIGVEVNSGGRIYSERLSQNLNCRNIIEIQTTQILKIQMIERIVLRLEEGLLKIPKGHPLIEELLSFRRDGRKMNAPSGKHDDCVMALAFALEVAMEDDKVVRNLLST